MTAPDDGFSPPCPCGRGSTFGVAPFAACCGRHVGPDAVRAPDAESLMRSRYTAYVRRDAEHLRATWDPSTRPARLDLDDVTWLGLEVTEVTGVTDATGDGVDAGTDTRGVPTAHVAFVATYRGPDRRVRRLSERSRFVRRRGRWLYVDGDVG